MSKKLKIGISIGDINGIGPEIIIKMLSDDRILKICTPIIYGSTRVLSYYKKMLNNNTFKYSALKNWNQLNTKQANVVSVIKENPVIEVGKATESAGIYALDAINMALSDWKEGKIDALVTAPINKSMVAKAAKDSFTGHTEYISNKTNCNKSLMVLFSGSLRVALVSNHVSLKEVPGVLSKELLTDQIMMLNNSLQKDFFLNKPKIAVLSLNPHSGDNNLIGSEELEIIKPAINQMYREGILVFGPYPSDGFFGSRDFTKFDGILAMYHDQGLTPFKALTFDSGVNFTAGIPIVRTSPDHGTAYDIAGKNIASEQSIRHALFGAIDIYNNRKEYAELDSTKLVKINKK